MNVQSAGLLRPSMVSPVSQKTANPDQPLSREMAQEFESLMLSQLIKQMRQSSGGEGLFPGDKSDTYGGMFDMLIGKYIAESGGFGVADELSSAFEGVVPSGAAAINFAARNTAALHAATGGNNTEVISTDSEAESAASQLVSDPPVVSQPASEQSTYLNRPHNVSVLQQAQKVYRAISAFEGE